MVFKILTASPRGTAVQISKAIRFFLRDDSFMSGRPPISVTGHWRILSYSRLEAYSSLNLFLLTFGCNIFQMRSITLSHPFPHSLSDSLTVFSYAPHVCDAALTKAFFTLIINNFLPGGFYSLRRILQTKGKKAELHNVISPAR